VVERNFFAPYRGVAHIINPGTSWHIRNNAVEPINLTNLDVGFVKQVRTTTTPGLSGVTIEGNWCGDAGSSSATTTSQIDIGGGPFTICNNLLMVGGTGSACIRAVSILSSGFSITGNDFIAPAGGSAIDFGSFAHIPPGAPYGKAGAFYVLGNELAAIVPLFAGTVPTRLIHDQGGYLRLLPLPGVTTNIVGGSGGSDARSCGISWRFVHHPFGKRDRLSFSRVR